MESVTPSPAISGNDPETSELPLACVRGVHPQRLANQGTFALSQKVLIGAGMNGWTKSESGATLTVGTLTALIRFYPSATGGFFLVGLGLGSIRAELEGFGSESETGVGALVGPERQPHSLLERLCRHYVERGR
jgi:hypothetical protein